MFVTASAGSRSADGEICSRAGTLPLPLPLVAAVPFRAIRPVVVSQSGAGRTPSGAAT